MPLLNWDALGRLAEQGVELGAHTRTHPNLARVSADRLHDEIAGSAERIRSETGRAPRAFAYPYGAVSDGAVQVVSSRFSWGCTTEMRSVSPADARALLPRLDMYYLREPGQLERWGTARFRYRLTLRAGARLMRRGLQSLTGSQ
jgi:peptidoglycan/xylan/chitin deacetylase (PgdA/CDA1 family)